MRFYAYAGFLLWLGATVIFRLFGGDLIDPDQPWIWLSFTVIVPGIVLLLAMLFKLQNTPLQDRPKAALLIAVPGMLLDLFSVGFYSDVFPSIPQVHVHLFFVWLLWAYSLILLSGVLLSRQRSGIFSSALRTSSYAAHGPRSDSSETESKLR